MIAQMEAADLATYALYISLFTTPIENILNFTETFQKAIAGAPASSAYCQNGSQHPSSKSGTGSRFRTRRPGSRPESA